MLIDSKSERFYFFDFQWSTLCWRVVILNEVEFINDICDNVFNVLMDRWKHDVSVEGRPCGRPSIMYQIERKRNFVIHNSGNLPGVIAPFDRSLLRFQWLWIAVAPECPNFGCVSRPLVVAPPSFIVRERVLCYKNPIWHRNTLKISRPLLIFSKTR